jgi:hypothetical protein
MGRNLQFEELQQPEPGIEGAVELVDPPAGKVMKGIFAGWAAIPLTGYTIDILPLTSGAKSVSIFPALLAQLQPGRIFAANDVFKASYVHVHHVTCGNLVSKVL